MNILVIKQTSLGDVLHATGHIRAIKAAYPNSHLTVLTANASLPVLQNHRSIDRIVTIDRDFVKAHSKCDLRSVYRHFRAVKAKLRERDYDLAFDLQGLWKSAYFLYGVKAKRKYIKGRYIGLEGFRDKSLHAIEEMNGVLALAGIPFQHTEMQPLATENSHQHISEQLEAHGITQGITDQPLIVISPFTRWPSKDWPLANYLTLAESLADYGEVIITASANQYDFIEQEMHRLAIHRPHNWAGKVTLPGLSALFARAQLLVTGDSFPMHLGAANETPLVALFGPTDEHKTGPINPQAKVVRTPQCRQCDNPNCPRDCLKELPVRTVLESCLTHLDASQPPPS